jgi:tetratricopeptide (TPR) repeat protein
MLEPRERSMAAVLVVPVAQWLLLPVPKVGSTLLKRLAVIADQRDPGSLAVLGETRPALAIHRAEVHGLPSLAQLPAPQAEALLADSHALRLAVTRHPGERLLSFWHDKLHLADPAYAPLNGAIQSALERPAAEACSFADFLIYLDQHWEQLRSDGHLLPQAEWLGDGALFNERLDRADLADRLPALLQSRLPAAVFERLREELQLYVRHHRQRLGKRWDSSYGKQGLAVLERLYGGDLERYGYRLPVRRSSTVTPLAAVDSDALVDPLNQLRDRHQQIAGLQQQILQLQQQLEDLQRPTLPAINPSQGDWAPHNQPGAGLSHLYEALGQQRFQEVLDLGAGLEGHPHAGEIAYLEGLAHSALGRHEQALRCFETGQARGFLTPYVLFNAGNACRALGNTAEGLRLYREALAVFPLFSECRHNLALALLEAAQPQEAERELRLLLRDQPSYSQAAFCLGNLLREHQREREAIEAFRLCLQFAPAYADAWNNLGLAQASAGELEAAITSYRHALTIDHRFKPSRQNLAQALVSARLHGEALEQFELFAGLELSTYEQVVALQGRINCLLELGRYDDALALADRQSDRRLQLMSRLHVVPVLYVSDDQVAEVRQRWHDDARELHGLLEGLDQVDPAWDTLYAHAWSITNFYLAYQMGDDRPLQELYAGILDRILRPRLEAFMQPLPQRDPADPRPLRVGVISPHLHNHNGAIWCLGWLEAIATNSATRSSPTTWGSGWIRAPTALLPSVCSAICPCGRRLPNRCCSRSSTTGLICSCSPISACIRPAR